MAERRAIAIGLAIVLAMVGVSGATDETSPGDTVRKRDFIYKKVGKVELHLQVYDLPNAAGKEPRAAMVFFFGGGWRAGSVRQFEPHARHLAEKGMVAVTADYRVASRHGTTADKCVEDGKSAVRWLRAHAKELQVDPDRIGAGGGSAGGHVAAAVALVPDFEDAREDASVSCRPNALVLFNPALVLAEVDGKAPFPQNRMKSLAKRLGTEPRRLSPYHHIRPGSPPTIVFHGEADRVVPVWTARRFAEAMKAKGNRCELKTYPGQPHGFFNYRNGRNPYYDKTVAEMDRFLQEIGFLAR